LHIGLELEGVLIECENMWRKLDLSWTPKWHGLREHALDQLMASKGFKEMQEDWVEHGHQSGNRDMAIYKSVKDYGKRATSMAKAAAVRNDKRVKVKVEEVREATKRTRRRIGPSAAEERKQQVQDHKEASRKAAVQASQGFSPTKVQSGYEKQKELVKQGSGVGSGVGSRENEGEEAGVDENNTMMTT
jgi:NDP-sugar pyrophosphorylase family protein